MTMQPGTSKVDLYEDCTVGLCQHPIGKAHTHNNGWLNINQVVVRREPPKPTLSHCVQRLRNDVIKLAMCRTREAVDERVAIIEHVLADIKKADVTR